MCCDVVIISKCLREFRAAHDELRAAINQSFLDELDQHTTQIHFLSNASQGILT